MSEPICLVKKDPSAVDHIEWLTLCWEEFLSFCNSPNGKGRYFIHLTDDVSYEARDIYIEAPKETYIEWKKEYDAHLYLRGFEEDVVNRLISLYKPLSDEGFCPLDMIAADVPAPEFSSERKDFLERLHTAICELPEDDHRLLYLLYLKNEPLTERQAAAELGWSKSTVHRRKREALKKISEFF